MVSAKVARLINVVESRNIAGDRVRPTTAEVKIHVPVTSVGTCASSSRRTAEECNSGAKTTRFARACKLIVCHSSDKLNVGLHAVRAGERLLKSVA